MMDPNVISTLLQSSGAAAVTALFVVYLAKRDKKDQQMYEGFNRTIQEHLKDANGIQRESNRVNQDLALKLAELTGVITTMKRHEEKRRVAR